ncbi:MAG: hypothetical protein PHS33_07915 [Candidatus Omnitrophica bacterium]|nr:hypothetical protein [Candidatus Omnitrophota bacterium]
MNIDTKVIGNKVFIDLDDLTGILNIEKDKAVALEQKMVFKYITEIVIDLKKRSLANLFKNQRNSRYNIH